MKRKSLPWLRTPVLLLALAVCGATAGLAWHDYRTTVAWQKGSQLLLERRAGEALELLATAFLRDMRGAQVSVLATFRSTDLTKDGLRKVRSDAATAFARYPYVESLFTWRRLPKPEDPVFFNRAERRPRWTTMGTGVPSYPVEMERVPSFTELVSRIELDAVRGAQTTVFQTAIGGENYQVVARFLYGDEAETSLVGVFGFTVNLAWVRQEYFADLAGHVAKIAGTADELTVHVLDEGGHDLVALGGVPVDGSVRSRSLPLFFSDPLMTTSDRQAMTERPHFRIEVGIGADSGRSAAFLGARRMLFFTTSAVLALVVGFVMMVKAIRTETRLADLQFGFVSTVTHNLKSPIASIRILGETLARGMGGVDSGAKEYGLLLVQETRQLARLVDNLLAYSRVTDVAEVYSFEPVALDQLVEKSLSAFAPRIGTDKCEVHIEIPDDLPEIRGDGVALGLVLDNLIDNALRYSREPGWLEITARRQDGNIAVTIADHGDGIAADELQHVQRKFSRGRRARSEGSGLGIPLAARIIGDHGGSWAIKSAPGLGTTVVVVLPAA